MSVINNIGETCKFISACGDDMPASSVRNILNTVGDYDVPKWYYICAPAFRIEFNSTEEWHLWIKTEGEADISIARWNNLDPANKYWETLVVSKHITESNDDVEYRHNWDWPYQNDRDVLYNSYCDLFELYVHSNRLFYTIIDVGNLGRTIYTYSGQTIFGTCYDHLYVSNSQDRAGALSHFKGHLKGTLITEANSEYATALDL